LAKDYKLVTTIRARYAETDKMGVVYNANYLTWFEITRTEMCRTWGIPFAQWEKEGIMLPVAECHCRYKHPAYYDDQIQLWGCVDDIKTYSITFAYRVLRVPDYKLIAEGWTKHACTDLQGNLYKHEHPFYQWVISHKDLKQPEPDGNK